MATSSKPAKKAKAKQPKRPRGNQPMPYSPATGDAICERIAEGESLRAICRDDSMPSIATVFRWLAGNPSFSEQYAHAREEQAETLADEIVSISDETVVVSNQGGDDVSLALDATAVARNRLRVDARKWVASKLKPKKYGDKMTQEHTGADGGAIQTVTTFRLADLE